MSLYDEENYDWTIRKGDTAYLTFEIFDPDGNPVDVTAWQIKFTARDPITNEVEANMEKSHAAGVVDPDPDLGIYYYTDTITPAKALPFLTATNMIIVILQKEDTDVDVGVYPYDLEIFEDDAVTGFTGTNHTPIKANLIIKKEVTE